MNEVVKSVEWWPLERFQGRMNFITTEEKEGGHTHIKREGIKIPDTEVVCDLCNSQINRFPCPVLAGYALCPWCQGKHHIKDGDDEYFETMRYVVGDEEEIPGVTNGGRRKE